MRWGEYGWLIIIAVFFANVGSAHAYVYRATYERWDGEIRPVSELTNPFDGNWPYKVMVVDGGSNYRVETKDASFKIPIKGWLDYEFTLDKISPVITVQSLDKLSNVAVPYNETIYYVQISTLAGYEPGPIIKFAKNWFWDESYSIYDSNLTTIYDEDEGENVTVRNRFDNTKGQFKVVNGELRLYAEKSWFLNAVYPITLRYDSFVYEGSGVQSCWDNIVCNQTISNGTDPDLSLILYNQTPFSNGLVGQWNFNDGNATNATDTSGQANHGVIYGSSVDIGSYGLGMRSNNINTNVTVSDSSSLQFAGDMAVSVWVKTNGLPSESHTHFVEKSSWSAKKGWDLFGDSGTNIKFRVLGSGSWYDAIFPLTLINDNKWHHIVGVRSGTTTYLYLDGVQKDSVINTNFEFATGDVEIGRMNNGTVDEVRVFNRSLSLNEVLTLYNSSYPTSGNVTTVGLGADNSSVKAIFSTIPSGTSFNMYQNASGTWQSICSSCSNNTWYNWSSANGQEVRIELLTIQADLSATLSQLEVNSSGRPFVANSEIYNPAFGKPNQNYTFNISIHSTAGSDVTPTIYVVDSEDIIQYSAVGSTVNDSGGTASGNSTAIVNITQTGSWRYFWNTSVNGNDWRYPTSGYLDGPVVNNYTYSQSFTVPSNVANLKAGVYWYGLSSNSSCTISLINSSTTITEFSVPTFVKAFKTIDITLPAIDYTITMTSGYREMSIDNPTPGSWDLRVQHTNVTRIETEVGWS